MLTKNEFLKEAMGAIIDTLEDGYNGYLCDLHNEAFNTDYYETNYDRAIKWFDDYEYNVWYIIGEEAEDILAAGCREEFDELWNSALDDNERKFLIAKFNEVYDLWK